MTEVVAFVRPSPTQLRAGVPLIELGRAESDPTGHFVLRAVPSQPFRASRDGAGWATVMLVAFGSDRPTLAIDSVAWKPDANFAAQSADASAHGRWVTSPAELLTDSRPGSYSANSAPSTDPTERPDVLTVDTDPFSAQAKGHAPEGRLCWLERSHALGQRPVSVGELHLNDAWGGIFEYTNTRSTSFQVGVAQGGSGWKAGGSVTLDQNATLAQEQTIGPAEVGATRFYGYAAQMEFTRFDWMCSKGAWD